MLATYGDIYNRDDLVTRKILISAVQIQCYGFHIILFSTLWVIVVRLGGYISLFLFFLLISMTIITALFNNMRTLKLKAQPTNAFFATVNQMFGGSSQLPTMLSELYSTI